MMVVAEAFFQTSTHDIRQIKLLRICNGESYYKKRKVAFIDSKKI